MGLFSVGCETGMRDDQAQRVLIRRHHRPDGRRHHLRPIDSDRRCALPRRRDQGQRFADPPESLPHLRSNSETTALWPGRVRNNKYYQLASDASRGSARCVGANRTQAAASHASSCMCKGPVSMTGPYLACVFGEGANPLREVTLWPVPWTRRGLASHCPASPLPVQCCDRITSARIGRTSALAGGPRPRRRRSGRCR